MTKKKGILIVLIIIFVGGYFLLTYLTKAFIHYIPPENYTSTSMYPLKTRILKFANKHNRLPYDLNELPKLEGFTNRTIDYWGNELIMKIEGSKVILISYGKDKMKGGINDNLDVVGVIETRTKEGNWSREDTDWFSQPILNKGSY